MDSGHTVTNRGVGERVANPRLLDEQPDATPYLGVYRRPPRNTVWRVREQNGRLIIENTHGNAIAIGFYALDRAMATLDPVSGDPVNFIRDPDGVIRWMRWGGRIARKD